MKVETKKIGDSWGYKFQLIEEQSIEGNGGDGDGGDEIKENHGEKIFFLDLNGKRYFYDRSIYDYMINIDQNELKNNIFPQNSLTSSPPSPITSNIKVNSENQNFVANLNPNPTPKRVEEQGIPQTQPTSEIVLKHETPPLPLEQELGKSFHFDEKSKTKSNLTSREPQKPKPGVSFKFGELSLFKTSNPFPRVDFSGLEIDQSLLNSINPRFRRKHLDKEHLVSELEDSNSENFALFNLKLASFYAYKEMTKGGLLFLPTEATNSKEIYQKWYADKETSRRKSLTESFVENRDAGNIIHPNWSFSGERTGRSNCRSPSLLNIGKDPVFRSFLRPSSYREGVSSPYFVQADLSQSHFRILAGLIGNGELFDLLNSDKDFHKVTAGRLFDKSENEVEAEERQIAKKFNSSILNGSGAKALCEALVEEGFPMGQSKVEALLENWHKTFPEVRRYVDTLEGLYAKCQLKTFLGREIVVLDENENVDLKPRKHLILSYLLQGIEAEVVDYFLCSWATNGTLLKDFRPVMTHYDSVTFAVNERVKRDEAILSIQRLVKQCFSNFVRGIRANADVKASETLYFP